MAHQKFGWLGGPQGIGPSIKWPVYLINSWQRFSVEWMNESALILSAFKSQEA